jgi:intein-encoded DNA endonuclease-like protein
MGNRAVPIRDSNTGRILGMRPVISIPEETLEKLYSNKRLNQKLIAKIFGCSQGTVSNKMRDYGISTRKGNARFEINREKLCSLYWNEQLSQSKIAEKIGCTRKNITYWMRKYSIDVRARPDAVSLGLVQPRLNPCPELAYAIGVILGDAIVARYERCHWNGIQLAVNDQPFASSFFRSLKKLGLKPTLFPSKNCRGERIYVARAFSLIFVKWFKSLKLQNIQMIVSIDKQCAKEFVRGFYESEGHFDTSRKRVSMDNTDKKLLGLIKHLLRSFRFKSSLRGPYLRKNRKYKPEYRLNILGGQKEAIRFLEVIKPCIKRG